MAQYIEDFLPPIQSAGLNTLENTSLGGTLTVTGATILTGATTQTGLLTATAGVTTPVKYTSLSAATTIAGGAADPGVTIGVDLLGIYFGGGPATVSAPKGSFYLNATGSGTTNRMYINTNGATSWTGVITVA